MPQSTFKLQLPRSWPTKVLSAMPLVVSLAKFSAKKSSLTAQFPLRKTRWTITPVHWWRELAQESPECRGALQGQLPQPWMWA